MNWASILWWQQLLLSDVMDIGLETLLETGLHLWSLELLQFQMHILLLYQREWLWVFWKTVVLSSKNRSPLHLHCGCAHNEQLYQVWYTFKSWSENWISEPGPLKNALLCILLEIAKEKICLGVKSAEFHLRHRVTPSQETQNQSNTHPLPLELSLQLLSQAFSRTGSTVLEHLHH